MPGLWPWMRPTGRGSRQPADGSHVHLVEALDQRQDGTAGSADEPPVMPGLGSGRSAGPDAGFVAVAAIFKPAAVDAFHRSRLSQAGRRFARPPGRGSRKAAGRGGPRPLMSRCRASGPDDQQVLMPGPWPWRRSACRGQGAPMRRPRPGMRPTGRGSRPAAGRGGPDLESAADAGPVAVAAIGVPWARCADASPAAVDASHRSRLSAVGRPSARPLGRGSRPAAGRGGPDLESAADAGPVAVAAIAVPWARCADASPAAGDASHRSRLSAAGRRFARPPGRGSRPAAGRNRRVR